VTGGMNFLKKIMFSDAQIKGLAVRHYQKTEIPWQPKISLSIEIQPPSNTHFLGDCSKPNVI
jgi:hypothetical protein